MCLQVKSALECLKTKYIIQIKLDSFEFSLPTMMQSYRKDNFALTLLSFIHLFSITLRSRISRLFFVFTQRFTLLETLRSDYEISSARAFSSRLVERTRFQAKVVLSTTSLLEKARARQKYRSRI